MIGIDYANSIVKMLKDPNCPKTIDASEKKLGDEGACIIAKTIDNNCKQGLKINLENNDIGERGLTAFSEMLKQNKYPDNLTLRFCNNKINDNGFIALIGFLENIKTSCRNLELDLSNNSINDDGAKKLIDYLINKNIPLHLSINLSKNTIGAKSVSQIILPANPNFFPSELNINFTANFIRLRDLKKISTLFNKKNNEPYDKLATAFEKINLSTLNKI